MFFGCYIKHYKGVLCARENLNISQTLKVNGNQVYYVEHRLYGTCLKFEIRKLIRKGYPLRLNLMEISI